MGNTGSHLYLLGSSGEGLPEKKQDMKTKNRACEPEEHDVIWTKDLRYYGNKDITEFCGALDRRQLKECWELQDTSEVKTGNVEETIRKSDHKKLPLGQLSVGV